MRARESGLFQQQRLARIKKRALGEGRQSTHSEESKRVTILIRISPVPLDRLFGIHIEVAGIAGTGDLGDVRRDDRLGQKRVPVDRLKVLVRLDVVRASDHVAEAAREIDLQKTTNEILLLVVEVAKQGYERK